MSWGSSRAMRSVGSVPICSMEERSIRRMSHALASSSLDLSRRASGPLSCFIAAIFGQAPDILRAGLPMLATRPAIGTCRRAGFLRTKKR